MKIGMTIPHFTRHASLGAIDRIIATVDESNWASLWAQDHIAFPRQQSTEYPYGAAGKNRIANKTADGAEEPLPWWEPATVLAYVAARTSRVALGTSVLVFPYRGVLLVAKTLATLDQLSRGRLICGAGLGWMRDEFEALGVGDWFEHRGTVTNEYLEAIEGLWAREYASYDGKYVKFGEVSVTPKPFNGSIPIWIGGNGPPAWRRVARFGQGWMPLSLGPDRLREARANLDRHLVDADRDPADVETSLRCRILLPGYQLAEPADAKNAESFLDGSLERIIEKLGEFRDAGVSHLILDPWVTRDSEEAEETVVAVGEEILPAVSSL